MVKRNIDETYLLYRCFIQHLSLCLPKDFCRKRFEYCVNVSGMFPIGSLQCNLVGVNMFVTRWCDKLTEETF